MNGLCTLKNSQAFEINNEKLFIDSCVIFSIIIPTYNRAHLIQETLDSVHNQTFKDWECIVVDDGSSDNTKDIVQTYCFKDSRFRYIYQNNAERSAARNNGIRHAKGEWICFLDSDDLFASNYLNELYHLIETLKLPNLIVSDFSLLKGNEVIQQNVPPIGNTTIADWLFDNPVSPSRACVHSLILQEFLFREDICIVEDTVLWVSLATKFPVVQLKKPLILYRTHEQNSVASFSGSILKRYEGLNTFFKDQLSLNVSREMKSKMLSEAEFRIAEYYKFKQKYLKALMFTFKSILSDFKHEQRKMRLFFLINLIPGFSYLWSQIKK